MWRYVSVNDLWRLAQATLLSMLFYIAATLYIYGFQNVPRSVFFLDAILTFLLSGGLRLCIRFYYAVTSGSEGLWPSLANLISRSSEGKSVLIVGAGRAGEKMCREILDNPRLNYNVVGFF